MNIIERIRIWFASIYANFHNQRANYNGDQSNGHNSTTNLSDSSSNHIGRNSNNTQSTNNGNAQGVNANAQNTTTKRTRNHSTIWKVLDTIWNIIVRVCNILLRLVKRISRAALVGLILNVVAAYFYPELPDRIPIIFGWYDGWMQFLEFAAKSALGYLNAFFHGNALEFMGQVGAQSKVLWSQFITWIGSISF